MGFFSFLKYNFIIFATHPAAHRLRITVVKTSRVVARKL
jgi:hypothetical protein